MGEKKNIENVEIWSKNCRNWDFKKVAHEKQIQKRSKKIVNQVCGE